jgi:fructose-bisphosphate aldolase class II
MLVNTTQMYKRAQADGFAIGGFNITSLETALGIIEGAEAEKSPVILQISEKTIDYMGLDIVFAISKVLADRSAVPVAIHFDHGRNFKLVEEAINIGFSSVMLDVSKMAEKERIPFVREFVAKAHRRHVSVEVEEDQIGGREDYVEGRGWKFTDPKRARAFVEATNCDAFAVSIGNSHGKALPDEDFDLELLEMIDKAVDKPLVLHGASSTPNEKIRRAIELGVRKINIDTDLRLAFNEEIRDTLAHDKKIYDPRDILRPTIPAVKKTVQEKIRLFGSSGKA